VRDASEQNDDNDSHYRASDILSKITEAMEIM
jgi:hypothetical protein